ncbi:general secretion pathway protein GspB [Aromatoleum diolicum]|uniref:GspB domain-containing protein n=1 Tax=Aromatoleum diolicum TaxID=75796 RepID=A0ABX1Q6Z9_9RHOO|nr:general secretion pathway protein GspB [Aromatoleum diolicum]NMG74134.1 GspB domain-containing protein [Aromatoleum diolicum]
MSYILEALQKSEHARQQGKVPDLSTVPVTTMGMHGETTSGRLRYVLAAFAITLIAAILGWWRPWQERPAPQSGFAQQATAVQRPATADQAPVAQDQMAAPLPPALQPGEPPQPARAAVQPAAPAPVSIEPIVPSSPPANPGPPRVTRATQTLAPDAPASPAAHPPASVTPAPVVAENPRPAASPGAPMRTVQTPAEPRRAANPQRAPDARSVPAAPSIPTAAAPAKPTSAPVPTRAPTERILSVHELPAAVRSGLPRLSVSGYSYSDEPGKRIAVINDRLLQEGEEAEPGVTLTAIAGDGVVLEFHGYRFRP